MVNFLINCFICATMLLGGNMEIKTIQEYILSSNQAQVIIDNDYYNIENINELNNVLNEIMQGSHTMPAFGVSIHTETLKSLQNGVWLKLIYNGTQSVDNMPFDELLIEVKPNFSGFNIIRGNKGIYEGRCFYIDLVNKDMTLLYRFINDLKIK